MLEELKQDFERLRAIRGRPKWRFLAETMLFDNGFQAVLLYRLGHAMKRHRVPVLGAFFARLCLFATGVEIAPAARIGPGLIISHGHGIVIGQWARIGARATLMQQVTLGAPSIGRIEQMPRLGDDVFVAAGARLIGEISLGDGAFVGANVVLAEDVPAGARVVTAAGVEIRQRQAGEAPDPTAANPAGASSR